VVQQLKQLRFAEHNAQRDAPQRENQYLPVWRMLQIKKLYKRVNPMETLQCCDGG
jgi:hypothetical protein